MVNWTELGISSSDLSEVDAPQQRKTRSGVAQIESDSDLEMVDAESEGDLGDEMESDASEPTGRRSTRLKAARRTNYFRDDLANLETSDTPRRPRGRPPKRLGRGPSRGRRSAADLSDSPYEQKAGTRRSERTRAQPKRSMRERHEDEISAASDGEIGVKVVGAKEVFSVLHEDEPFRRRHRQQCDTCLHKGDSGEKGPLVFCQGCSNSHHKFCLGPRGTRDHLVTKVSELLFVLQCRRCIGVAQDKDPIAPHLGHCSSCQEVGPVSAPFRQRLTTKQEQTQREENGGRDPVTVTEPWQINHTQNVLFRCAVCQRGWHMHHLPERKTAHTKPDEEEDEELTEEQLDQKRFEHYHRSWTCKDCVENQSQIDVLVAWRPINLDEYTPGYTGEQVQESRKEYLVKWRNQSYLRATWMPGDWVWGVAAGSMRGSFYKKPENKLPRMTTKDAIPEDYFRIDIVFDVHYSSIVRNSTKEIDLARVKEVDMAYVKYKGLGYEDAIWEKPPSWSDTERFSDYKVAYEDYVLKLYVSIPSQAALRSHLTRLRNLDFETQLMRKNQPATLTGGEIMQYQMEGLNWLYYQWFKNQNAVLADEMGLGKTIQLIAFFALLVQEHRCWPFLVVVPNSTCPNWRREIKKWAPTLRVVTYYGSATARHLTRDYELFPKDTVDASEPKTSRKAEIRDIKAHIVITSYDSIVEGNTRQSLMKVPWQGLIVDEGQRLKNEKNQLYDILSRFRIPFKVLLTGTPLQNNVRELFNLLQFLDRSINAAELETKYAHLTEENVVALHELLRPFFLRRTKAQVLTFLPTMAQIIVPVTMSPLQKKVYKSILAKNPQLMKSIFSRMGPNASKERVNLNNILMHLRKTLCHPFVYSREIEERSYEQAVSHRNLVEASSKLQLLSIMLPKLKDRGHRVLLFSQFLDNLDIMEDFLDGLGFQHRRLDGSVGSMEKQKRIDEFNAPNSPYFAFLLSTRAGGVGINLATADTVIILDPDFNPHQDIQALSRAHRIGQKQKVLVFQLVTRASAEEKMMQIGKKKMALDQALIEQMDEDDDTGVDLESILRHGAAALFEDEGNDDITYDSASVDRLLDRTQVEDTKISEDKSAESQFSFARIWANDKSTFETDLGDTSSTSTPNPGIWDKILEEREKAYLEEAAKNAEKLGRGKRRRQNVDYGVDGTEDIIGPSPLKPQIDDGSDTDFQARDAEEIEDNTTTVEDSDATPKRPTVKARPFKRAKVPTGAAPHFGGDGTYDYVPMGTLPPNHHCTACEEVHPMGWCRLKIAGVEHCGLCGLAHLGHGRTCPHLNSEGQVATLLQTLKESTESRELIDEARKYLRGIRGDLVQRKRNAERARLEAEAKRGADVEAARAVGGRAFHWDTAINGHSAAGMNGIRSTDAMDID